MTSNIDFEYLISSKNVVFQSYCFWIVILVLKMFAMFVLTKRQRMKQKITSNPEDIKKGYKIRFDNPQVERVRRAHRNDLENILPFFLIGFIYILTNPEPKLAINLFRAIGLARLLHTIVYTIYITKQPARALAFIISFGCTIYMAVESAIYFF